MLDTMTFTKIIGGFCGALLIISLAIGLPKAFIMWVVMGTEKNMLMAML